MTADGFLMDITQELHLLSISDHLTDREQELVRHAVLVLQSYQTSLANIPSRRFDMFFAAALQGILARSTAGDLMSGKGEMVNEARRVAKLCIQAQPGEDS